MAATAELQAAEAQAADAQAFLRTTLPRQAAGIARYALPGGDAWLKKAPPRPPAWRFAVLAALAGLLRLDALRPVRHRGGGDAVATEARRLGELAALGLRVPAVLALQPGDDGGLLIAHAGAPGSRAPTLDDELHDAARAGDGAAVLARWQEGLDAIATVHAAGAALSQAFARNLVRWGDGGVGFIDFEDDPLAELTLADAQARDVLCWVHSTALYLRMAGVLEAAASPWQRWLAGRSAQQQRLLARAARRMHWLRRLPADRRLGRDLQKARAAADLLSNK